MLENDGMIKTEILGNGNRRKHLLTVVNWEKYQEMSTGNYTETVPEIDLKQYPNVPPNKNDKNDKNVKNDNRRKVKSVLKTDPPPIDFEKLMDFWNTNTKTTKIEVLTEKRKKAINARMKEHGKNVITEVLRRTFRSSFLNGENEKNWKASFDWIFKPENFVKILEGNYDNKVEEKLKYTPKNN